VQFVRPQVRVDHTVVAARPAPSRWQVSPQTIGLADATLAAATAMTVLWALLQAGLEVRERSL